MTHEHGPAVTVEHLARKAVVYVRQSSRDQVRDHSESTRLQLALREKAIALGWPRPVVIDQDLGVSASGFADRPGFQSLLAQVATREVGIIICVEASRLSRNSKDWAHLLELCGYFGTLIADADQIYDMSRPNDRLLMGIKGTVSEMELGMLRQRLRSGYEAKAARGELRIHLPVGYAYGIDGKIVFHPDKRVRIAVETMFKRFDRFRSVRQLAHWYRDTGTVFPSTPLGKDKVIRWVTPSPNRLFKLLTHPIFGGAYVYGRRETIVGYKDGKLGKRVTAPRSAEESKVCIHDHHPGYITWKQFLENRAKISENRPRWLMRENQGAVRDGLALLVGLLRCGKCGRRVRVRYRKLTAVYYCDGGDSVQRCISFGSILVDAHVSEELCKAIQPHAIEASIQAAELKDGQRAEDLENASLHVEAMQYQADRAFEQFDQCDPKNRHVADTLEERLNERLADLNSAKERHQEIAHAELVVSEDQRARLKVLAQDFSEVWNHAKTDCGLKKQLLRAAIREILVASHDDESRLELTIHWQGGVHSRVNLKRRAKNTGKAHDSLRKLVRELAGELQDPEIARILNLKKIETPGTLRWTQDRVRNFRRQHHIKAAPKTTARDTMTMGEVQQQLGIGHNGVLGLVRLGAITTNQVTDFAPWRVSPEEVESERVRELVRFLKQMGRLPRGGSPQSQPGLFHANNGVTPKVEKGAL